MVRNRALYILAVNAQWDDENRFAAILPEFLSHIMDEKPITASQCIKTLALIGQAKPQYIPRITEALREADFSQYKDSMRPLIKKDIEVTNRTLQNIMGHGGKT